MVIAMPEMTVNIKSNLPEVQNATDEAILRALEKCGLVAERYAKKSCPVDTGALRNSITHTVDGNTAYIGTNMEYAPYIEFGTGIHAEEGGRKTPWSYQDGKGNWHRTDGYVAHPFLRPAVSDHTTEYKQIIESELKK